MYPAFIFPFFRRPPARCPNNMTNPDLYAQLRLFLDGNEITEPSPDLLTDQRRRFASSPDIVLQPRSVESVQNIMRFCFKHKIPVTPQGGNTGLCGAAVAENGVLLNLSKLNRIREINLADNSITVDAGAVLQNVQQAAAEAGRLFPRALPAKVRAKSAAISPAMRAD